MRLLFTDDKVLLTESGRARDRADHALYAAKGRGRKRVVWSDELSAVEKKA